MFPRLLNTGFGCSRFGSFKCWEGNWWWEFSVLSLRTYCATDRPQSREVSSALKLVLLTQREHYRKHLENILFGIKTSWCKHLNKGTLFTVKTSWVYPGHFSSDLSIKLIRTYIQTLKAALSGQAWSIYPAVLHYSTVLSVYTKYNTGVIIDITPAPDRLHQEFTSNLSLCLQPSFLSPLRVPSDTAGTAPVRTRNTASPAAGLHFPEAASRDSISWMTLEVFSKASKTQPSLSSSVSTLYPFFLTVIPDGLHFAADVLCRMLLLSNKTSVTLLRKKFRLFLPKRKISLCICIHHSALQSLPFCSMVITYS